MQLFFSVTDGRFLGGDDETTVAARTFLEDRTVDGMPFLLDSRGAYVSDVNAWLRGLPGQRVPSQNSWRAYARDVCEWGNFLEARGLGFWEAEEEDLNAFYRLRRLGKKRVDASSWTRAMCALDRLYTWALGKGLVRAMPFEPARVREKGGKTSDVQFLSRESYFFFRDVGLRGLLPDGTPDVDSRVENVERNSLFADLLVTTGLRLQEAAFALLPELPPRSFVPGVHHERWHVPAGLAKGQRERYTLAPVRVLKALEDYRSVERAIIVARARQSGAYVSDGLMRVDAASRDRARNASTREWFNLREAKPEVRERLLVGNHDKAEPLALFLNEEGLAVGEDAWESAFRRASARCARFGQPLKVSPHVLRHTYATLSLTDWLRRHIAVNRANAGPLASYVTAPMRALQRRMGHSQITTTWVYLDLVGDIPELLEEALSGLELDLPELGGEMPAPYPLRSLA